MNRLKIERHGLAPADLPAALLVHELLGAAMASGFWAACYAIQPSSSTLAPIARRAAARHPALQRLWGRSVEVARANVGASAWVRRTGADPARLTLSLAESLALRACIKPGTFVFKLWASAAVVKAGKRVVGGGGRRARLACVSAGAVAAWGPSATTGKAVRRVGPWAENGKKNSVFS